MVGIYVDSPKHPDQEELRALRAAKEAADKEAFENWHDPTWRRLMAQDLATQIYYGFDYENILQLFAEVEFLGFNDRTAVRNTTGLKAHWVARGGNIETSTLHSETWELPRDTLAFRVEAFEDKLQTNFSETQSTLVDLGMKRMDAVLNQAVFAAFQAAVPSNHASYISASGLSLNSLNLAIRQVRDETMADVAIVGRSSMTEQIQDLLLASNNGTGFLPVSNEDMVRRGVLGTYRGAPIVTLKNYKDDMDMPFFPANELWVIGKDASKWAFFGGLKAKEGETDDNWYWHFVARRDFGGVVYKPANLRRIVDTSISATQGSGGRFV